VEAMQQAAARATLRRFFGRASRSEMEGQPNLPGAEWGYGDRMGYSILDISTYQPTKVILIQYFLVNLWVLGAPPFGYAPSFAKNQLLGLQAT